MTAADYIQIAILLVMLATLIIGVQQAWIQNQLRSAQLLRDRFEMYWKLYDPLPDDMSEWMSMLPSDFMPLELFEREYKEDKDRMRKYVALAKTYEYLAFEFTMRGIGKDPLGSDWTEKWVGDLVEEDMFLQINDHYGEYYPAFFAHVNRLALKRRAS